MIRLLITDLDGTLANTLTANTLAYREAFSRVGIELTDEQYRECFGLGFGEMCEKLNVTDENVKILVHKLKKQVYPKYFEYIVLNKTLVSFIEQFKSNGGKVAICTDASRENVINLLSYFNLSFLFDCIITRDDVKKSKPSAEGYLFVLNKLNEQPENAIVFEDSEIGFEAAKNAGINYIKVKL